MKRRTFLRASATTLATTGVATAALWKIPDYTSTNSTIAMPTRVQTVKLSGTLRVHAIMTGTVAVKHSHREYNGPTALRFPVIMADWRWTDPLPIWTWVIEHPGGTFLVDTGENTDVLQPSYLNSEGTGGRINGKILRLDIQPSQQINEQLLTIGLTADAMDAVILTHLHLDHTDGLRFFPRAEVLVGEREWKQPYGWVPGTLPRWLKPNLIRYQGHDAPVDKSYRIASDLWLIPTPGHSFGHQSVLLRHEDTYFLFAGDTSFSQQQLQEGGVAGICADPAEAKRTYQNINALAQEIPLVYLPSHDPDSAQRLLHQATLPA